MPENDNNERMALAVVCFKSDRPGAPEVLVTESEEIARVLRDTKRTLGFKAFLLDIGMRESA